jgi:hypothetical protein
METNPILKTELGEIVHSRNEQYQVSIRSISIKAKKNGAAI